MTDKARRVRGANAKLVKSYYDNRHTFAGWFARYTYRYEVGFAHKPDPANTKDATP